MKYINEIVFLSKIMKNAIKSFNDKNIRTFWNVEEEIKESVITSKNANQLHFKEKNNLE